jgi:hypothetical protein
MTSSEPAGNRLLGTLRSQTRWSELHPGYEELAVSVE